MRQLLAAAIGLALAYGAASDLPLPFVLRLASAATVLVGTGVLVLWRPAGRAAEEWAFVLLRFWAVPRVAVWRPRESVGVISSAPFEVVLRDNPVRLPREEGSTK